MRYAPDYKATARAKLLESSASLVKKKGFGSTGVDALMAEAGMTSGAFYSHFKSKSELLQALLEAELQRTMHMFDGPDIEAMLKALRRYLSMEHMAAPETGCVIPSLGPEIARADQATRLAFEQGLRQLQGKIQGQMPASGDAWAAISMAVGAIVLSRAMHSEQVQQEILDSALSHIETIALQK